MSREQEEVEVIARALAEHRKAKGREVAGETELKRLRARERAGEASVDDKMRADQLARAVGQRKRDRDFEDFWSPK